MDHRRRREVVAPERAHAHGPSGPACSTGPPARCSSAPTTACSEHQRRRQLDGGQPRARSWTCSPSRPTPRCPPPSTLNGGRDHSPPTPAVLDGAAGKPLRLGDRRRSARAFHAVRATHWASSSTDAGAKSVALHLAASPARRPPPRPGRATDPRGRPPAAEPMRPAPGGSGHRASSNPALAPLPSSPGRATDPAETVGEDWKNAKTFHPDAVIVPVNTRSAP